MRKVALITLCTFVILASAVAALLFTPIASEFILKKAAAQAEAYGVELQVAQGKLIPLSELDLRNVVLHINRKDFRGEVKIAHVHASYTFKFFPLKFLVHEFVLSQTDVTLEHFDSEKSEPTKSSQASSSSFTFDLEHAQVEDLKIAYRQSQLAMKLGPANLTFSSKLAGGELSSQGRFDLGSSGAVNVAKNSLNFKGQGAWDLAVTEYATSPKVQRLDSEVELEFSKILFNGIKADNAKLELHAKNKDIAALGNIDGDRFFDLKASTQPTFAGDLNLRLSKGLRKIFPTQSLLKANQGAQIKTHFELSSGPTLATETSAAGLHLAQRPSAFSVNLTQSTHKESEVYKTDARLEIKDQDFGVWKIPARTEYSPEKSLAHATIEHISPGGKPLPISWKGPISVEGSFTPSNASAEIEIPELNFKDAYIFSPTSLKVSAKDSVVKIEGKQGPLKIVAHPELTLTGLEMSAEGRSENQIVRLPRVELALGGNLLRVKGEASMNLKTYDAQLSALAAFRFSQFQGIDGQIDLPLTLTLARGQEFSLNGELHFVDTDWKVGEWKLTKINGAIPLSERLKLDSGGLRFTQLINENPFERVDFNRVRPLLNSKRQLKIQNISWKEKIYGPWNGFVSLAQNMLSAHAFDMDLGQGKAYGELFFNFYPKNLQLGFLGRLTDLNLTEFLPKEFLKGQDVNSRDLSARAGLVCNLNRSTLEGRIDVTEIGGRQLTALMNILDPNYADDKFNKLRNLLQIGYPTSVNAAFSDGFMDMDVDLNILSLVKRESVRGVPLSEFISRSTESWVQKAEEGFLQ